MNIIADLHIHSTASDGKFSPTEIIRRIKELGLTTCALTDHDTVDGIQEAAEAAEKYNIRLIPGIELNTDVKNGEVHILGYFIPYKDPEFIRILEKFKNSRLDRMKRMIENINKLGLKVYIDEVLEEAKDAPLGRPHLARVLLKHGYVFSKEDAFKKYLEKGRPGYEPHDERLTPFTAVKLIKQFKGVSVIAHPGISDFDDNIPALIDSGLDGIEVFHSKHDEQLRKHYLEMAIKNNLLITGGSDCHGEITLKGLNLGKSGLTSSKLSEFLIKTSGEANE